MLCLLLLLSLNRLKERSKSVHALSLLLLLSPNRFNLDKRCNLMYGNTQGTVALVRKYKDERVVGEDRGPKVYITSGRHIGQEEASFLFSRAFISCSA
ncbi:hypothetical protein BDB00DRAFT_854678, partial [Zychaea mexicana]|uniref:uncharacterized protein n=1 Tax=Zychaea mexicana TaxID=64656 RepID=UPI0022FEF969